MPTTVFFATDVHGSDICWKKFINAGQFYGADILILGGDMTGKAIVPIVHQGAVIGSIGVTGATAQQDAQAAQAALDALDKALRQ